MKIVRIGVAAVLVCFAAEQTKAFEKVGTTSFQFLKVMTDARSTAMGEAFSSVARNSAAVFWNPGALTYVGGTDMQVSYVDWLLDTKQMSVALARNFGNFGAIGLQGIMVDYGSFEETRVENLGFVGEVYNPGVTGRSFRPSALVVGASYARALTDKFSFGLTAKVVHEDLYLETKTVLAFDAGLLFDTGYRTLKISAVVRHFGREVKYVDKSYPMPQTFTIGISGYLLGRDNFLLFPSEHHRILLSYDLSHPRDYDQQHHLGFEYSFNDLVFIRGGYKFNYDEEGLAFGFGLRAAGLRFDYSYADFGEFFRSVHRFSVGFGF